MKKRRISLAGVVAIVLLSLSTVQAQDNSATSKFSVGADLYTNYIFRGTRFGQGPSLQPSVKYVNGALTVGAWGAFDFNGYSEADPYFSVSFPFGLSLGMTDYYYPGLQLFDFSEATGAHALEINAGFTKGGLTLNGNYIINQAGGAASAGGDMYFQAGYAFSTFSLFAGAGDGWHTSDGKFAVCNVGLSTSKVLKLSDSFSIPVTGQVIVNPEREQMYLVVGFSF